MLFGGILTKVTTSNSQLSSRERKRSRGAFTPSDDVLPMLIGRSIPRVKVLNNKAAYRPIQHSQRFDKTIALILTDSLLDHLQETHSDELDHHSGNHEGGERQEHGRKLPRGSLAAPRPPRDNHRCRSATIDSATGDPRTRTRRGAGGRGCDPRCFEHRTPSWRPMARSSSIRRASAPRPRWHAWKRRISSLCRSSRPLSMSTACWIPSISS